MVRRTVTDRELEEALACKDYENVVWGALRDHAWKLDRDTLRSCALHALWRALQYHDPALGKFTTSLHLFTSWEVGRELKRRSRERARGVSLNDIDRDDSCLTSNGPAEVARQDLVDDVMHKLASLGVLVQHLIRQYYLEDLSLEEVARVNGISRGVATRLIREALPSLR